MATLLLRLAGPLQAWGTDSKVDIRRTDGHPSKSGVIGMIAAAMGRSRDDPLDDLKALDFGVRVDQEGTMMKDYHTVHHPDKVKLAYITERYYLEDAVFLVGLEGDEGLLESIDGALRHPYFPLFLGRRSCPVTGRLSLGIRKMPLRQALKEEPWLASDWYMRKSPADVELEMTIGVGENEDGYLVRDEPESYSQARRAHGFRKVATSGTGNRMENTRSRRYERATEHDAMKELEGLRCFFPGSS